MFTESILNADFYETLELTVSQHNSSNSQYEDSNVKTQQLGLMIMNLNNVSLQVTCLSEYFQEVAGISTVTVMVKEDYHVRCPETLGRIFSNISHTKRGFTEFLETGGTWRFGKSVEFYSLDSPEMSCQLPDLPDRRVSHTEASKKL